MVMFVVTSYCFPGWGGWGGGWQRSLLRHRVVLDVCPGWGGWGGGW